MKKFNNLNEEINRIKSLFTEERLYGNLVEKEIIVEAPIRGVIKTLLKNTDDAFDMLVKYGGKYADDLYGGMSGTNLKNSLDDFNAPLRSIDDMAKHFDSYKFFYKGLLDPQSYKNLKGYYELVAAGRNVDPMRVVGSGRLYSFLPKELDINAKILSNYIDNLPTQQAKLDYINSVRKYYTEAINDMRKASVDDLKYSDEAGEQVVKHSDDAGEQVVKQGDQIDDIGGRTIKELDGKSVPATSKNIDEFGNAIDDLAEEGNVVVTEVITHSQKQIDEMIELNNRMVDVIEQQNAARLSGDQVKLKELDVELKRLDLEMKKLETPKGEPKVTVTTPPEGTPPAGGSGGGSGGSGGGSGGSGGGSGGSGGGPWWHKSEIINNAMTKWKTKYILNPLAGKGPLSFTRGPFRDKNLLYAAKEDPLKLGTMRFGARVVKSPIIAAITRVYIIYWVGAGTVYDYYTGKYDTYGVSKGAQLVRSISERLYAPWDSTIGAVYRWITSKGGPAWEAFCQKIGEKVDNMSETHFEKCKISDGKYDHSCINQKKQDLSCDGVRYAIIREFGGTLKRMAEKDGCDIFYDKDGDELSEKEIRDKVKAKMGNSDKISDALSNLLNKGMTIDATGTLKSLFKEGVDVFWKEDEFMDEIDEQILEIRKNCEDDGIKDSGTSRPENKLEEGELEIEEVSETNWIWDPIQGKYVPPPE
tara:strand:- start:126 stop:2225 length:2100 start_codon:yes stop_codon:yes gene_type:complete